MIVIKDISIIKSGITLFKNFSWDSSSNENWVISGRNGSGKTLLLEALAGILHFPRGEIQYDFINGETWQERYEEKRRLITYIPAHALHTFLRGGHDLYYQQRYYDIGDEDVPTVGDLLGVSPEKLNVLDIPESLSVAHLLDIKLTRLSNGQLKKFLLLKSLLKGMPKLLLLDCPFEGLDHGSREDLCQFIAFISLRHSVQVILVDDHHHLPACITNKLTLDRFQIQKRERFFSPTVDTENTRQKFVSEQARMLTNDEIIDIRNLTLRYGNVTLFQNFNLRVNKGQRWALVGRNGTGKTTLFSLIFADHPKAYAQEIYLFGRRRGSGESIWDIKRRINYLGPEQISYLNPKSILMKAGDYIKQVDKTVDKEVLDGLVQFFDASEMMNKQVSFLSSGELQLLMIMTCFLSNKELLLLDEPFQYLDSVQRDRLAQYLLAHLKRETTMIMITHYEHDLRQWTDMKIEI